MDPLARQGREETLELLGPLVCREYLAPLETPVPLEGPVSVEILAAPVHLEEPAIRGQAGPPDQSECPELPVLLERLDRQVPEDK